MLPNVAQIARNTRRQVAFLVPRDGLWFSQVSVCKDEFESLNFMTSGFEYEWAQEHTNPQQIRGGKSLQPVTGVVILSLKHIPSAKFSDESKLLNFNGDELWLSFQNSKNV